MATTEQIQLAAEILGVHPEAVLTSDHPESGCVVAWSADKRGIGLVLDASLEHLTFGSRVAPELAVAEFVRGRRTHDA